MTKLANTLVLVGLCLAVVGVLSLAAIHFTSTWKLLGSAADAALMLASFLVLLAVFLKYSRAHTSQNLLARDVRIVVWIAIALFTASISNSLVAKDVGVPPEHIILEEFHRLYHRSVTFDSQFLGVPSVQFPADNWVMQEIIAELTPDFIVETGTASGGTTLFYATVLDQLRNGKVITVDINDHDPKVLEFEAWRERVQAIKGSSTSPEVFERVKAQVEGHKVLVTLDSHHTQEHVLEELHLYSTLVPIGSYIVVQDTHLNGHPVPWPSLEKTGGPMEAVKEFLRTNKNFEVDRSREKHIVTQYPFGFLKRVS